MADQRGRGEWGEAVAERYLRRRGWRIVARRWRWHGGEIDLIALRGPILAAVEVKVRRRLPDGVPAVPPAQCRRLADGLEAYAATAPHADDAEWRIDLVVVCDADRRLRVHHHPGLLNPADPTAGR